MTPSCAAQPGYETRQSELAILRLPRPPCIHIDRHGRFGREDAYSYSLPLLVPACLLLDGPAELPQMLPEGV
jgi:hypothetical protein